MILAGDIGGTNTRLALFEPGSTSTRALEIFPSPQYRGPEEIALEFLAKNGATATAACFGIAGPVRNGHSKTPNLPWEVDAREVAQALRIDDVRLINDLEANAHGIAVLGPGDFTELNAGDPQPAGARALISAGTGLGEAGLLFENGGYRPFPSEGGHADFAPRTELEIELLRFLMARWPHVSYERVLSGPGLLNIYQFLRDTGRAVEPGWLADRMEKENPVAVVSNAGLEGAAEICIGAVDIFLSVYGAEAGNLALRVVATGGLYLGGGIAPRMVSKLKEDRGFLKAFTAKGRMSGLLETIPVRVIMNDKAALLGAARVAERGMM